MAKKNSVTSSARASAGKQKSPGGGSADPRRSAKARSSVDAPAVKQPGLSNDEIGQAAGQVWQALADQGGQSLTALKKSTGAPAELVLAAVGWLAREDKLDFATNGRSVTVSLRA